MADKKNTTNKKVTTKRKAGAGSQAVRIPKISWVVKPQTMTLVEWQRALRKQVAAEEPMAVAAVDEKNLPGEYEVKNPQTKQTYKVVYRGEESPWNYCSCLDFKTSRPVREEPLQEQAPTEPAKTAVASSGTKTPRQPKELVAQGISFLSGLADTLKSPEATAQLVETLVETDAETGQTSLRIPVPDKQTVRNLLDIVGKLFG